MASRWVLLMAFLFAVNLSFGQSPTPNLQGFVYDSRGKAVEGATVSAGASARASRPTDGNGHFSLEMATTVRAGDPIRLRVEKPGFRPWNQDMGLSDVTVIIKLESTEISPRHIHSTLSKSTGDTKRNAKPANERSKGSSSATQWTWETPVGGPGGEPFQAKCKEDEVLIGLIGRQSDFRVLAVGPICSRVRFDGSNSIEFTGDPIEGDQLGATEGGETFDLRCLPNEVVVGAVLQSVSAVMGTTSTSYLVNHSTIKCSKSVSGSSQMAVHKSSFSGASINYASSAPFDCPNGQVAGAINGRAGQWIDALGIGCRDAR